jgi:hypothetical protein
MAKAIAAHAQIASVRRIHSEPGASVQAEHLVAGTRHGREKVYDSILQRISQFRSIISKSIPIQLIQFVTFAMLIPASWGPIGPQAGGPGSIPEAGTPPAADEGV